MSIEDAIARAAAWRRSQGIRTDIERILGLPVTMPPEDGGEAHAAALSKAWRRHPGAPPFRGIQGWALSELASLGRERTPYGLFCPVGVGYGKTGIGLFAGKALGAKRPVLMVPPEMRGQLARDVVWWSKHYTFTPPRVLAYSELSQPGASDLLERLAPDLIVADECHALRHAKAARTKRFIRYFKRHPETRFVGMSGTVTDKAVTEYGHLMELALRDRCSLPLNYSALEQWGSVIDVKGEPDRAAFDAMWPLVVAFIDGADADPFRYTVEQRVEMCRDAYRMRYRRTAGVISTTESALGVSLHLTLRRPNVPAAVSSALRELRDEWKLPDGTELIDALRITEAARQISAGFFYAWEWPGGVVDEEWMTARAEWSRQVRHALRYASREGHDSPALIERACDRGKGPPERVAAWRAWKKVKHRPKPPTVAHWLSKSLIDDVERWVGEHPRALIWYQSKAVGEELHRRGFAVFGEGTDAPPDHIDTPAVSIAVHHKGKNLQGEADRGTRGWCDQIVIEPPSGGAIWEQMLARTHRPGQLADQVDCTILNHTWAARAALEEGIARAEYIERTTGQRQKLNFASWGVD